MPWTQKQSEDKEQPVVQQPPVELGQVNAAVRAPGSAVP